MKRKDLDVFSSTDAVRLLSFANSLPILLVANGNGISRLEILSRADAHMAPEQSGSRNAKEILDRGAEQLRQYFEGELRPFDLPLDLSSLTPFQRSVLEETARIPFGSVLTYGEVAIRIGKPNSARAVGGALARNPIAIIIPCHRVVAHDGKLHGFSSPEGIRTKANLLQHEGLEIANDKVRFMNVSQMEITR